MSESVKREIETMFTDHNLITVIPEREREKRKKAKGGKKEK